MDCAQSASELKDVGIGDAQLISGLLIINANDGEYNESTINSILNGLSVSTRRNPINIFIATNREIIMWTSLFKMIHEVFNNGELLFIYPSINNLNKVESKQLPINALYSRYLFAQYNYQEDYNQDGITGGKRERKSSIMFSFDDVSADSFRYIWSMFKACQRQGQDYQKYIFYFYPKENTDMSIMTTKNFLSIIDQEDQPLKSTDKDKIELRLIDNRTLSPIDTLGGA